MRYVDVIDEPADATDTVGVATALVELVPPPRRMLDTTLTI